MTCIHSCCALSVLSMVLILKIELIRERNSSVLKGRSMKSSAPALSPMALVAGEFVKLETKKMDMSSKSGLDLICRQTSNPSTLGMTTSSRTKWGRLFSIFSSASWPEPACSTENPALVRMRDVTNNSSGSSSAIRIRGGSLWVLNMFISLPVLISHDRCLIWGG